MTRPSTLTSFIATPYGSTTFTSDDRQRREHHVEAVRGHAGVPVHRPAVQPPVGQQVVAQVRGAPHVGAEVATGRRGVVEHEVLARERVEVDDVHHDRRGGGERDDGDDEADDAVVGPRPVGPLAGATDDPVDHPLGERHLRGCDRRRRARRRAGPGRTTTSSSSANAGSRSGTSGGASRRSVMAVWLLRAAPSLPVRPAAHESSTTIAVVLNAAWARIAGPSRPVTQDAGAEHEAGEEQAGDLDRAEVDAARTGGSPRAGPAPRRSSGRPIAAAARGTRAPRRSGRRRTTISTSSTVLAPPALSTSSCARCSRSSSENASGKSCCSGKYSAGRRPSWATTPSGHAEEVDRTHVDGVVGAAITRSGARRSPTTGRRGRRSSRRRCRR